MDINELYINLVSNKLAISEALALSLAFAPLTPVERKWVESERNGSNSKLEVPEYRQLPCEVKAKLQNVYSGTVQDTRLVGQPMNHLEAMLNDKLGLSIYKIYVSQGVESIEQQVRNNNEGNIIMVIDGPPGEELRNSIASISQQYNCDVQYVFQTTPIAYMQNALTIIKNRLLSILQCHLKAEPEVETNTENEGKHRKVIFISYCWESDEHKKWVRKLANDLRGDFEVIIDAELPLGVELTKFMEQSIAESDKVLIIVTPKYKDRADNRKKGVGYETSLITDDLVNDGNRIKFIPIIRKGTKETSYPYYLGSRRGLDMTDDNKYAEVLEDLKRNLKLY